MQDQVNYNIEDTGKLMTQSARGSRNRRMILIIAAIAAVLIVALVAGFFVLNNKKYEDQIAIADKMFAEGNYEQAEAEFIKAMNMNKRKPRAKEGLAYTYAVEGKFDEATKLYEDLYSKTKEDKHKEAAEDTKDNKIPLDPELIPAKNIWREVPVSQIGYYTALKWYLYYLEADYFSWPDNDSFNCNKAGTFPALWLIMNGDGKYDISIEDFNAYALSGFEDESYLEDSILEQHEGVDPRKWVIEDEMYDSYVTADAEEADQLMRDIFNMSDEDIKFSTQNYESYKLIYPEDGTYYCLSGWDAGKILSEIEVVSVWSDGYKYCVKYYGGWDTNENMEPFTVYKSTDYEVRYALIEPKLIDGKHYWSLYSVDSEMPKEAADGLNAATQTDEGNKKSNNSAEAYRPVIEEYKEMLAYVDSGKEFDAFDQNNNGFTYVFSEMIPHELNGYTQPLYAIKDINGDGVDEMIVGAESDGDSYVGSLLTLDENGEPEVVTDCESFMYRGELNIYKDGTVMYGGSSGYNSGRYEFYTLEGTGLNLVDSYVEQDGACDHNGESMSEDKWYKAVERARDKKHMKFDWNSF